MFDTFCDVFLTNKLRVMLCIEYF